MLPLPTDSRLAKAMAIFTRWIRPAAEEWFTLVEWMLVISALAFVAQRAPGWIYDAAFFISVGAFGIYIYIGFLDRWTDYTSTLAKGPIDDSDEREKAILRHALIWALGGVLILAFTLFVASLAVGFATEVSDIVNG